MPEIEKWVEKYRVNNDIFKLKNTVIGNMQYLKKRKETAIYLGISIPRLDRYIADNKIPYIRLPLGAIRFLYADIDEWISKLGKNKTK
ncbi:MAG: helix-turn-helix domain-containing protein [Elusimicrobia bacterium]|nr:helix-turn-helix domain-containing protein [Candidatus Liberimonas magnetica]